MRKLNWLLGVAGAAAAVTWSALTFPHAATSNSVLFDREIVRIIDKHCVMCHMDGGPASAIETWEQAWLARNGFHDEVLARHMPPWAAVSGYGKFSNANHLTLREMRFIVSWVEGLGPRNNGELFFNVAGVDALAEPVTASFDTDSWHLGEPDQVISVAPVGVGAGNLPGTDMQWYGNLIDTNLLEEYRLTGLEFLPDDRSRLHAVVFSLATDSQWLATWTPWHGYREFVSDTGIHLAPGERLVVNYLVSGRDTPFFLEGRLGLHLAESTEGPKRSLQELRLQGQASGNRLQLDTVLEHAIQLTALWPELPAGTDALEVTARNPDGRVQILLLALDLPEQWPTSYLLETPAALPAGTVITATATAVTGSLFGPLSLTLSAY
jgi:hypothetical protein